MLLIYKIKKYDIRIDLENLDFKMKAENLNVFSKPAVIKYEDLKKYGYCYVYRKIEMTDINQVEYLVINEDFDFSNQLKKHHDIISLLRERKINEILD